MGHNAANSAGDNEPEDDPEPFTKHWCPLGDGSLSHFLGFYLSDSVIRHAFPASEGAAVTFETAGIAGFVALITNTLSELAVATKLSSGSSFTSRTVQLLFLRTFLTGFSAIGFSHFLYPPS
jgi:hypothetical protein